MSEWTQALVDERFSPFRFARPFADPLAPDTFEGGNSALAALASFMVSRLAPGRHQAEAIRFLENAAEQLALALSTTGVRRPTSVPSGDGGGGGDATAEQRPDGDAAVPGSVPVDIPV